MPKLVKNPTKKVHPYVRKENSRKALKSAFQLWTECAKVYQAQADNYYLEIKTILAAEPERSKEEEQRMAERIGDLMDILTSLEI